MNKESGVYSILWELHRLALLAILPFLVLVGLLGYLNYRNDHEAAEAFVSQQVARVSWDVSEFVSTGARGLRQIASRPNVRHMDAARCDQGLRGLIALQPRYDNIALVNRDGLIICASELPRNGQKTFRVADTEWFRAAMAGKELPPSPPRLGALTGRWISIFAAPVRGDSGEVVGAAVVAFDLAAWTPPGAQGILPVDSIYGVLDSAGTMVMRYPDPDKWVGSNSGKAGIAGAMLDKRNGVFEAPGVQGFERIWAVAAIPGTDWVAFAGIRSSTVFGRLKHEAALAVALSVATLLFALWLSWGVSRRLGAPIAAIGQAVRARLAGNLVSIPVSGTREIREVGLALNNMIQLRQQAAEALAKSEMRFSDALDHLIEGCMLIGFDWTCLYVNPAAARQGQVDRGALMGRIIFEVYPGLKESKIIATIRRAMVERTSEKFETEYCFPDRGSCWFEIRADPAPEGIFVLCSDITERKRSEAVLREHDSRYRAVVETSGEGFWVVDRNGRLLDVNEAYARRSGYTRAELLGMRVIDLDAVESEAEFGARMETLMTEGGAVFDAVHRTKRGTVWQVEITATYQGEGSGHVLAFLRDITEREAAGNQLQSLLQQQAAVLNSEVVGIISLRDRVVVWCNHAFERILGYEKGQLVGKPTRVLYPDDASYIEFRDAAYPVIGRNEVFRAEGQFVRKDGSRGWFDISGARLYPDRAETIWSFIDITEKRRARVLLQARVDLAELAETATLDDLMQQALDKAESITGSKIGFFHFVDPDQKHVRLQAWSTNTLAHMCTIEKRGLRYPIDHAGVWVDAFRTRAPVIHNDYASQPHKKGLPEGHAPVTRELVVPIIRNDKVTELMGVGNKDVDYVQHDVEALQVIAGMVSDLIGRRRVESALLDSEARFKALVEQAGDGFELLDEEGRYLDVNVATCVFHGYSRGEMLARTVFDIVPGLTREKFIGDALSTTGPPVTLEATHRRKDGTTFPVEVTMSRVNIDGMPYRLVLVRDITSRQQTLLQMRDANEQLRNLAARLDIVREEEAARLARELHDQLGQELTALKMDVAWISTKLHEDQIALKSRAESAIELADIVIGNVADISASLRPPLLDEGGLLNALIVLADDFEKRFEIDCRVVSSTSMPGIEKEQAAVLYRIVQEALTNVARHSSADGAEISVSEEAGFLTLKVSDDGVGIGREAIENFRSIGLLGMKERALAIRAQFEIKSGAESGTVVTVVVPLSLH